MVFLWYFFSSRTAISNIVYIVFLISPASTYLSVFGKSFN
ncbi:hypothetical protein 2200_scaffold2352_00038 [Bacteriophage sp.]|nr:hypothetical protein 2200_scaffold2352_00038 [Bacteriophage sp.]